MNSYNNDGYEIIDSNTSSYPPNRNNDHSRYPYTYDPKQIQQIIDYQKTMQPDLTYSKYLENPKIFTTDWSAIANTSIIIVGTLIALHGPLAVPGAILISVGTALPLLWPKPQENQTWREFLQQGNSLFPGKELNSSTQDLIIGMLNGLQEGINFYLSALETWKKNPYNHQLTEEVINRYYRARDNFVSTMPVFALEGYEPLLLSIYAKAAFLHLTLLREGIHYANDWELDPEIINLYKEELTQFITKYINHCEKYYDVGLKSLYHNTDVPWDVYNHYRRELTLSVLNVIAFFPQLDLKYFPNSIQNSATGKIVGISPQITQKLYISTPNLLPNQIGKGWVEKVENLIIPPLTLFRWLEELVTYTNKSNQNSPFFNGVQNRYTFTEDISSLFFGPKFGVGVENKAGISSNIDEFLISLKIQQMIQKYTNNTPYLGIPYMQFSSDKGITYTIGTPNCYEEENCMPRTSFTLPNETQTYTNYDYILSDVTMVDSRNLPPANLNSAPSILYLFAFTHKSADLNNKIQPINKKNVPIITQIPVFKAFNTRNLNNENKSLKIRQQSGHTGGNLIEFDTFRDEIQIKFTILPENTIRNYKLRVRYAASNYMEGGLKIGIPILSNFSSNVRIENTGLNPSINIIPYEQFKYTEEIIIPDIPIGNRYNIITLENRRVGAGTTIIDKIEFIPM